MIYLTMLECQDLRVTGINHLKCKWFIPVTRRSCHSNIDKYIINYKPDILNGLSQSHVGLAILTLIYDIFINVRMPRPMCDWDKPFKMSGL
jgi:hypothetical protein